MVFLTKIDNYSDSQGNEIISERTVSERVSVNFRGKNNRLIVDPTANIQRLDITFDCDNGSVSIGRNIGKPALLAYMRVGQDSRVIIGDDVSSTRLCVFVAVEGTTLRVGNDVMIASSVEIRTDDAHPIFDVASGMRVNPSTNVTIGDHVWLGNRSVIMSGTEIGDGSVVGHSALVKGRFPNNCIIAGVPARILKQDIAWERPHLSLSKPFYKPDASTVAKSPYWNFTTDSLGLPEDQATGGQHSS